MSSTIRKLRPDEAGDAGLPNSVHVPDTATEIFSDGGPEDSFPLAAGEAGGSITVSAAKPVATIAQLADYLVNGFWAYNSALSHHFASNTITYNISGLNAAEQFLAQSALAAWHDVANINFVQTSGSANITFTHNGTMTAYANASWTGSGATISATVNISTDWVTTDGGANDGKTGIDSYAYQTYIHEIGHALGLGHQGPYNGSANYSTNALYANDTWQYSVMSYFAEYNYSGSSYRYVVTPQMADIYAVATMYGAATTTRTGDTVYGFNSNAGAVYSFGAYTSAPALTIYDNGGNDTLDCSLYSNAQRIDLHAGSFSSVGGLTNNIGIALNAVIEKAIGGSGNDTLIANDLGCTLMGGAGVDTLTGGTGIDRLIGGSGRDTMSGGGGADNFVFAFGDSSAASGQHDRVADFISGTDRIDVSAIDAIAGTAAQDLFRFLGSAAFDGATGALNYFYNSSLGVTILQGDTNGDRVADFAIDLTGNITLGFSDLIGVTPFNPVVIEAFGSTQLSKAAGNYYVSNGGSTLSIKYAGTAIYDGQFGNWIPIAAENTASGYNVVLKFGIANQYVVWSIDGNGNYLSNTAPVSGSAPSLTALESSFQQDLNGDGTISSPVVTVIEALGSTQLSQIGSNYYLSTGGVSGPSIKLNGAAIVQGQFGNWTPIAAEQGQGGYSVVLKFGSSDQYLVWSLDGSGNYISNTAAVSGSSPSLTALEQSFHQDLNGDGTISSPVVTVIEAFGSTQLSQVGSNYYLSTGGVSGPSIKFSGAAIVQGQFGNWTPIAAEQSQGGYSVVLKFGSADQYLVWNIDGNGNYISNTAAVSGSSPSLTALEQSFHQDLNGDGTLSSAVVTVIEAFGSTQLSQVGANYLLSTGGASGPAIKFNGAAIGQGQFGSWTPIAAEQTASGYSVVLKNGTADQYLVWSTDSNGNYISNTAAVNGSASSLVALESSFHQDLNGDGTISSLFAAIAGMPPGSAYNQAAEIAVAGADIQSESFELAHRADHLDTLNGWHLT